MKNRRNIVIAFLLCACLLVGIGYASLTTNLMLNGSAKIDSTLAGDVFDAAIVWDKVDVVSSTTGSTDKVTADIDTSRNTITVRATGLDTKNEIITVTCWMKNNSTDTDAVVTIPVTTLDGDAQEYINVVRTNFDANDNQVSAGVIDTTQTFDLPSQGTAKVVITFELKKEFVPTGTLTTVESVFNLIYNVEAVAPSNP